MSENFYITTPIYYVNDMPHIGHIYTTAMADLFARYHRMRGANVHFLTGTDEHGQKIARSARDQGIEPIELADRVVERYHQLWRDLEISNDDFIRTTEPRHTRGVEEIIRRIDEAGDIYKGEYEGWYSAGEEAFIPDSQVEDGHDTATGYAVERLAEPSYFFRLSAFQDRLLDWYRSNPECIRPQTRLNEVVSFVESGLRDLSISRASLKWGIPYPGDDDHVVYVWLDALTNYISALGFGSDDDGAFGEFWPASLHLVGKDILRFHCVYWPAFLMSAGLPLPRQVFGHGWWLRDDAKMSKSIGNVVRPDRLMERFGADALRYFLAREMAFGQDSSFSDEAFVERFNADLANTLGNTASRTSAMVGRSLGGRVPAPSTDGPIPEATARTVEEYHRRMASLEPHRALEAVWQLLASINSFIQERQPWALAKQGDAARPELEATLYASLESLRITSLLIEPVMPTIAERLRQQVGAAGLPVDLNRRHPVGSAARRRRTCANGAAFPENRRRRLSEGDRRGDHPGTGRQFTQYRSVLRNQARGRYHSRGRAGAQVKETGQGSWSTSENPNSDSWWPASPNCYEPEDLVGRRIVVVANLKPAKLMGVESRGMLLAASVDGKPFLLSVDESVPPGTEVR